MRQVDRHEARARRYYRFLMVVLPRDFRDRHGEELAEAFEQELRDARHAGGRWRLSATWVRAAADLTAQRVRRSGLDRAPLSRAGDQAAGPLGWRAGLIRQDVVDGVRSLPRSPGFTTIAVATLAIGIAGTTAMFAIVNAVLLAPLPYPESNRLVAVWQVWRERPRVLVSSGAYLRWRDRATSFEELGLVWEQSFGLAGTERTERVDGARVTPDFFRALGVAPAMGRAFSAAEGEPGAEPVVIIGDGLWRDRFGRDPGVLGKQVRLDGAPHVIVGVMPPGFRPSFRGRQDLWVPLPLDGTSYQQFTTSYHVVGRLAPDVPIERARLEMRDLVATLSEEEPEFFTAFGAGVEPLLEQKVGATRPTLLLLSGAVGVILLMACSNIANLMMARNARRAEELGVRRALGADRARIATKLVAESVALAVVAGSIGLFLAQGLTRWLSMLSPADLPRVEDVRLDGTVLGFALLTTLGTSILFGVLPAFRAAATATSPISRVAGRAAGRPAVRASSALVTAQVAMAIVLLIAAGLAARSFVNLLRADTGFDVAGQLVVALEVPESRYPDREAITTFFEALEARVAELPEVETVGLGTFAPLRGTLQIQYFAEGHPRTETLGEAPMARYEAITSGYFEALGIELKAGRAPRETMPLATAYPEDRTFAYINEAMANDLYPDGDALGKTIFMPERDAEIVGVVADVRQQNINEPRSHHVYVPHPHLFFAWRGRYLVIRTAGDPSAMVPRVREALGGLDPDQAISEVLTLDEIKRESIAGPRFNLLLLALFGANAIGLAALGVYGVVSFAVGQRLREAGVRKALGARDAQVVRWIIAKGMVPVAVGTALGLLAAVWLSAFTGSILFEVDRLDLATYATTTLVLLAVGLSATWIPALRAGRADPVSSLRR